MRPIVCFIDDSKFEHDLVKEEIAPCAPDLMFFQHYTFEEARRALGTKKPSLFLLDLWGLDESIKTPYLTPKADIRRSVSRFPTLDDVYEGLDDYKGDVTNEYLKRLFLIVDHWRSLFEEVCNRIGQNRKYGLANIQQVKAIYPGVPSVFYTRKSLMSDAVAMLRAGTDGLYIKPTGSNDMETRRLTRAYAPELIRELKRLMGKGNEGD